VSDATRLVIALLLAALLIGDRIYVWELSSYATHEQRQYHAKADHDSHEAESPLLSLIAGIEEFLEAHEKSLIVLSTLAIAGFTGTLWRATTGLQDLAAKQASDMDKSLRLAAKSAKVAERSVNTMERTAERELRAYAAIKHVFIRRTSVATPSNKLLAKVTIVNVGKTIAKNVRVALHVGTFDDLKGPFPIEHQKGEVYLHPNIDWNIQEESDHDIDADEGKLLVNKKKFVVVWGEISYFDGFSPMPRITAFRFTQGMLVFADNLTGWDVTACDEGNDAT
jgi:hypothetical protein